MFAKAMIQSGAACAAMTVAVLTAVPWSVHGAETAATRPVAGIQDNSFLVEEAYNQETGIVQHIGTAFFQHLRVLGADEKRLDLAVTQEWPVYGQTHQFSYTVPMSFVWRGGGAVSGLSDVMLHYRWQAWFEERSLTALAPRLSLILPTGNAARGLGEDTVGMQFNLPFSTTLAGRWFVHANGGATLLPDAASADGRALEHWHLAGSVILAATGELHLLVEWVGSWLETMRAGGGTRHEFASLVAPGIRKAFNFRGDVQLVVGVAAPVGWTHAAPDFGAFLYASLEHPFKTAKRFTR